MSEWLDDRLCSKENLSAKSSVYQPGCVVGVAGKGKVRSTLVISFFFFSSGSR